MNETNKKPDSAFSILTLDIVTNILALSDSPGKLGQYLTDEIRELTGARTVVVVQCLHKTGKAEHSIVTVNPHRRQNITESPQFESLIEITHNLEDITWWHQDGDSGAAEEILAALGLGLSIAIPLHIGDSREGAILLFDLPQERHIDRVIEMLRTLCPVVALILRNSFLYTQQENIIAERTSQLEEEKGRLAKAQEIGLIGTWELDLVENVLIWTKENYNIFGIADGTDVTYETFLEHVHPDDREYVNTEWMAGIDGKPYDIEHRIISNGKVKWVREKAELIFDNNGKAIRAVGLTRDITKRKQAEEEREKLFMTVEAQNQQLIASQQELKLKNEELQSIVYISSHDLKTPLININGFSELLIEHCGEMKKLLKKCDANSDIKNEITSLLNDGIPTDLDYIATSSKRMQRLIEGLLQVSRIGTVEIKTQNINMNDMVSEIINNVKYKTEELGAEIAFENLPDCTGDKDQITQVFTNLIDNALKYLSHKRKGIVSITGKTKNKENIYCIEDNGIGIDLAYHGKVFEIYHRLDPQTSTEGDGLGLTIVRRILDRHKARIWLESEPDKGSKFFIAIPTK